jgi:tRNA_anti-like
MFKHCIFAVPRLKTPALKMPGKTKRYQKWLVAALVLLLAGAALIWYLFTLKYEDTATVQADFTVNATDLISEFRKDMAAANQKYSEKIVIVNGVVSAVEPADTTMNIKMIDTAQNGAYIIFAFQQQHLQEAKAMKPGDRVSIKGSLSNGVYSNILETEFISFKRSAVNSKN